MHNPYCREGRIMRTLLLLLLSLVYLAPLSAEIAPLEYRTMQLRSPEQLTISVKSVSTCRSLFNHSINVTVKATVLDVLISSTNLKAGDEITIVYTHERPQRGWTGPRPIRLLRKKETTAAFLVYDKQGMYTPAARGASFQSLIETQP